MPPPSDRRQLARDLVTATRRGAFTLLMQPRVRLSDGHVVGAEATLRWPRRRHGALPLHAFAALAERLGLLGEISAWLLREACAVAACWPEPLRVAVDLPLPRASDNLPRRVCAALEASGLDPDRLDLELPETWPLTDDVEGLLMLSALRDLGIGLVLAAFGGAVASLTALRRLPLTAVKLDRALVRGVAADPDDTAVVRATATASRALGLELWAEGVESEPQRMALIAAGCRQAQGYLFGSAVPADQAEPPLRPSANTMAAPSA
jgi:EAL domain-containing protein (putative c-di-GMP-specific phosphodiesterase class I)